MTEDIKKLYKKIAKRNKGQVAYPFNEIIDEIGIDNIILLSEHFGGSSIYIPKIRYLFKTQIDEAIKNEFDGGNYVELAEKYGLCEKSIRNIIADKQ